MGDIEPLLEDNTKTELRQMARGRGFSIPRGSTKDDIARMLAQSDGRGTADMKECDLCGGAMYETEVGLYECRKCTRRLDTTIDR